MNETIYSTMGKGNRNKSKIKKGRNNSESDNQNLEGKQHRIYKDKFVSFLNLVCLQIYATAHTFVI